MTGPLPSPKSRLRAVYTRPLDPAARTEDVIYQLEDTGHPVMRSFQPGESWRWCYVDEAIV